MSGGFTVKAGKNGKPPKVTKIHYTTLEDDGSGCPPVGSTVKVKGSHALRKALKYSENPGPEFSPWTLSKKDAPPVDDDYVFDGIKPAKATVVWGGNSYAAELAMFFDRERPGKPFRALVGALVWYDADGRGLCGYDANAKPEK